MTMNFLKALVVAGTIALAGCSTVPTTTPTLDEARADFVAANNNPQVATYAQMEFKQAGEALDRANQAAAQRESLDTIDRLAYIAKQKIATAQEVAKTKSAEAEVANAARERDRVQLEARTAEADRAKRDAAAAQAQAAAAQAQAQDAQAQAAAAQQQAAQQADRAARLEALLVELHAQKTERGMVVTIGDVLFATDRAELNANGMATVKKLAEIMTQNPDRTVMVEGFTDSTGTAAHNKDLSERRAASVAQALVGLGVPRERIGMRGYGEAFPVASNDTAANRQLNRRVEIVLSNAGAPIPPRAAQR
ncbi:flagellar motor protein MotB [Massilia sp. Root133]|uniref:OmpA family protein n=4 Tax=Massilia TaxID=149698 RepID=A0A7X3G0C4_9BURK|nr:MULTISPECIES: OmpA family protein [Telluria group]KQY11795.1 flagellar motor protein MotB [Massilia sp. Root133]KQZ34341.1 flagellar motor protein MotB [Massilia sp. Root1485]MDN4043372.1 OmpA family protein [Massilia sp. YIM B02787]MVW60327.1 OmpA family protein [Telluria cellulosilytica]